MTSFRAAAAVAICLGLLPPAASHAQTPSMEHAAELSQRGDIAGAMAEFEQLLAKEPDNLNALVNSARYNLLLGNLDAARGRIERVVRLAGNNAIAWEVMVQIAQAQGDLKRRDEALERWKVSVSSAIDPEIRLRTMIIRERIPVGKRALWVADYFDRTGPDFTRYQFTIGDPAADPDTGLLLRTDSATSETWAQTALLPPDKPLFHLDSAVRGPDGEIAYANYQFFVGQPDYDTVRAKVLQILRGEAKPLSGDAGPLFGILREK